MFVLYFMIQIICTEEGYLLRASMGTTSALGRATSADSVELTATPMTVQEKQMTLYFIFIS